MKSMHCRYIASVREDIISGRKIHSVTVSPFSVFAPFRFVRETHDVFLVDRVLVVFVEIACCLPGIFKLEILGRVGVVFWREWLE